jgi:hypothetical protein
MTNVKDYLKEYYPEYEDLIVYDGLDDAFIGVGFIFNKPVVCYDRDKIIIILMTRDDMRLEEAEEFFEFNIAGCYAGEYTPLILEDVI